MLIFFRNYFDNYRSIYLICCDGRKYRVRAGTVFHILYQYVHFSGVCSLLSEYGVAVVFYHTDQGQMVWDSLRSFHCPFLPSDKLGWKSGDHCIHVQFHPVFPDDEKLQQGFTKRNPSEAKFQKADQSDRQIRYYQAQVCDLRQNRAGR